MVKIFKLYAFVLLAIVTFLDATAFSVATLTADVTRYPSQEEPQRGLLPQEKRGKAVYLRGVSPSGQEIKAFLGDLDVPASTLTCAGCHGFDGQGKTEGGVTAGSLIWQHLIKPYGHVHPRGRLHPAFTEASFARAITKGIDPAGNDLAVAMPRYRLSQTDLADLISYLKRIETDRDPGVTETNIIVGTILPVKGPLAGMGQAMKEVMAAYFEEVNSQGGIYNRRIELRVVEAAGNAATTTANAKRLIEEERVFSIVGAFTAGADEELAALIKDEEVPLVGAATLFPQMSSPPNRYVFYMLAGLKEQARALVNFAAQTMRNRNSRIAVVYPESRIAKEVAGAIHEQCKKSGWEAVVRINYSRERFDASQVVRSLKQEGADVVFFLGSGGEEKVLIKEAERMNWTPSVLLLGALVGKDILETVPSNFRMFLAYPTIPADLVRAGALEYRALLEKQKLSSRHVAAQLSAYSAAKILVEGLKLAGKDLSREKLVIALEGLYEFDTGVTPRITYGPNRRVGALGAYIVSIDPEKKEFIPVSEWVTSN